jgi:hypothetical protein
VILLELPTAVKAGVPERFELVGTGADDEK